MKPSIASLVIAAVLVTAALVVPGAEARAGGPSLSRAPATERLRAELRATRATVAKLKKRVSALQARLHAPSPLAVAVNQVRTEVAYVKTGVPYSRGQLVSEAAMDYVAGHVSDTEYGYLESSGGKVPSPAANAALRTQAGICTGAAVSFATIVHRLGFRVRSVNFFYFDLPPDQNTSDGHVGVEVYYDDAWHYFEPTYGLFWTDPKGNVLSIHQVRAGQGTLQKNVASFTNVFEDAVFGNDVWFLTDPNTKVKYGIEQLLGVR